MDEKEMKRQIGEVVKMYGLKDEETVLKHLATTNLIIKMLFTGMIKNKMELFQIIENEYPDTQQRIMAAYGIGAAVKEFCPDMWTAPDSLKSKKE